MIQNAIMAFYCAGFGYILANWEAVMEERKEWPPKTRKDWVRSLIGFFVSVAWPLSIPTIGLLHWRRKRASSAKAPVTGDAK